MAALRPLLRSPLSRILRPTAAFASRQPELSCDYWNDVEEAEMYAKYRPEYQATVIPWLIDFYRRKNPHMAGSKIPLAIDLHCGNGQLAGVLASHCDRVIGIDISQAQLDAAKRYNGRANVEYWRASHTDLVTLCGDFKADIVTIGLGIPTFNCKEFYDAVAQSLRPGGVFGAFGYLLRGDIEGRPYLGRPIDKFLTENLTSLRKAHFLLQNHYRDINLPFDDQERREARVTYPTSNERMVGIIRSFLKDFEDGEDTVDRFRRELPVLENARMHIDVFAVMAKRD